MLQFLADYRDQLYRDAFLAFINGTSLQEEWDRFRGQYITSNDVVHIQFETLCNFYGCQELMMREDERKP